MFNKTIHILTEAKKGNRDLTPARLSDDSYSLFD